MARRDAPLAAGAAQGRRGLLRGLAGASLFLPGLLLTSCSGRTFPTFFRPAASRIPRIGYLDSGSPGSRPAEMGAFQAQLRDLDYVEGQTIAIEYRYARGDASHLRGLAAELAGLGLDAIAAYGTQAIAAARDATASSEMAIVMTACSDPLGSGFVQSLTRPGGRITGVTSNAAQLTGKRLQLLREASPQASRVAYFWDSNDTSHREARGRLEAAGQALSLIMIPLDLQGNARNIPLLLARAVDERADALLAFASAIINDSPEPIIGFAEQRSLPAIYALPEFVTQHGGLMAYGPNYLDLARRAAIFLGKVLKGSVPAQLPVEMPRRLTLVVSRRAAHALRMDIPRAILAQIDEVV